MQQQVEAVRVEERLGQAKAICRAKINTIRSIAFEARDLREEAAKALRKVISVRKARLPRKVQTKVQTEAQVACKAMAAYERGLRAEAVREAKAKAEAIREAKIQARAAREAKAKAMRKRKIQVAREIKANATREAKIQAMAAREAKAQEKKAQVAREAEAREKYVRKAQVAREAKAREKYVRKAQVAREAKARIDATEADIQAKLRLPTRRITYIIQEILSAAVKIGITRDVEQRLKAFQLHTPNEVVVCAVFNRNIERKLHAMFSEYRIRGEWFIPSWEMKKYINEHADDNRCQVAIPTEAQAKSLRERKQANAR